MASSNSSNIHSIVDSVTTHTEKYKESIKLNTAIAKNEKQLLALYQTIGQNYCEQRGAAESAEQKGLVDQAIALKRETVSMQNRLQELKGITRCPACGAKVPEGAKFCAFCGAKLVDAASPEKTEKVCPACGAKLAASSNFCTVCGAKLEPGETEKPDAEPETQSQTAETQDAGPETPDQTAEMQDAEPETQNQTSETSDAEPETPDQTAETQDAAPETQGGEPETQTR